MKKIFFALIVISIVLSGCGAKKETKANSSSEDSKKEQKNSETSSSSSEKYTSPLATEKFNIEKYPKYLRDLSIVTLSNTEINRELDKSPYVSEVEFDDEERPQKMRAVLSIENIEEENNNNQPETAQLPFSELPDVDYKAVKGKLFYTEPIISWQLIGKIAPGSLLEDPKNLIPVTNTFLKGSSDYTNDFSNFNASQGGELSIVDEIKNYIRLDGTQGKFYISAEVMYFEDERIPKGVNYQIVGKIDGEDTLYNKNYFVYNAVSGVKINYEDGSSSEE